jgi:hypothetical protein
MKTFCVLPFFSQERLLNGTVKACCLLPDTYQLEHIQQAMIAGQQPRECEQCWRLENNAQTSTRQLRNQTFSWIWERDLEDIFQDVLKSDFSNRILKLETSNTCNSTCLTCYPGFSSSWAELHRQSQKKNIQIFRNQPWANKKVNLDNINWSELLMLSFQGGEPFYEKKNFEILEHLISIGNTKLFVGILTNGSVDITDHQKRILEKFPNLNVCLSVDGVGSVFEYMRFPLQWEQFNKNFVYFKSITSNISANCAVSNVNIWYLQETIDWFHSEYIKYMISPVFSPPWFRPSGLTENLKSLVREKLSPELYQSLMSDSSSNDTKHFNAMIQQVRNQDLVKGIKIQDYLTEWVSIWSSHGNTVFQSV